MTGWYASADSKIRDEDGRPTGEPNVVARFEDHRHLGGPDLVPVLLTRYLINAMGYSSGGETSSAVLRFDLPTAEAEKQRVLKQLETTQDDRRYNELLDIARACDEAIKGVRDEATALIRRYPEAWKAYQKYRKTKVTEGERLVCAVIFGEEQPRRGRKPKAPANVVSLKVAEAS